MTDVLAYLPEPQMRQDRRGTLYAIVPGGTIVRVHRKKTSKRRARIEKRILTRDKKHDSA